MRSLTLANIKPNNRLWDNEEKRWVSVTFVDRDSTFSFKLSKKFVFVQDGYLERGLLYKPNRFYRKEVNNG